MKAHAGWLAIAVGAAEAVMLGVGLVLAAVGGRTLAELVWGWGLAEASVAAAFGGVGAVLAWKRPGNPLGWLFLLLGWGAATGFLAARAWEVFGDGTALGSIASGLDLPVPWVALFAVILLLFPDGELPSRRWRPVLWLVLAGAAVSGASVAFGLRVGGVLLWDRVEPLLVVAIPLALVGLIGRLRRGGGAERQQVKVVVFSTVVAVVAILVGAPLGALPVVNAIAVPAIPVAIAVAITRHGLYDIDRIINRTVVYAIVIAVLGGAYVALVVALQALLRPLSGESDLAVAASTLAIAAAFGPVRRRVRSTVDRGFNRSRYDAVRTVDSFGQRLRDELSLEALAGELRATAATAVQPVRIDLWLGPQGQRRS
ncbi:MAG: hypothetical protein M3N57_12950 [Actinomycetota bacterium]|nr:hypothetical protein [Actinomycetota bacterium]